MFELIGGRSGQSPHRTAWPMIVSTVAHLVVVGAVIVIPLLYVTEQLPDVPDIIAFVAAPPTPPPPPPPPPAPRAAAAQTPRAVTAADRSAAPLEAPSTVEPETGIERSVEGDVPGGVEGGVPGGVVGGIVGGLPSEIPPPPLPPPVRQPVRVGGQLQAPTLIERVAPRYPDIAVTAHIQGTVILEATVDENGRVQQTRVLRSIPLLDDAAIEAVRQWRYSPLRLNDEPCPFILTVTVSFRIPADVTRP